MTRAAFAQSAATDYRALVGVFLFGGNDGNPPDPAGCSGETGDYQRGRGRLAPDRGSLTAISPTNTGGRQLRCIRRWGTVGAVCTMRSRAAVVPTWGHCCSH